MNIENSFKMGGLFKVEAIRPDKSVKLLAPWQENMILNTGLDAMAGWVQNTGGNKGLLVNENQSDLFQSCFVGSGSTPPAFTDTQLVAYLAASSSVVSTTSRTAMDSEGKWYKYNRKVFLFNTGVATGNLSEIAVGQTRGAVSSTRFNWLLTRALIKDQTGVPTTVTVLADEQLQITYEIRMYIDITPVSYKVMDGPTEITCVTSPLQVKVQADNDFSFTIQGYVSAFEAGFPSWYYGINSGPGAIVGETYPVGSNYVSSTYQTKTTGVYTLGTYSLATTFTISPQVNIDEIGLIVGTNGMGNQQISFTPRLRKRNDEQLTLVITTSWGRFTGTMLP